MLRRYGLDAKQYIESPSTDIKEKENNRLIYAKKKSLRVTK